MNSESGEIAEQGRREEDRRDRWLAGVDGFISPFSLFLPHNAKLSTESSKESCFPMTQSSLITDSFLIASIWNEIVDKIIFNWTECVGKKNGVSSVSGTQGWPLHKTSNTGVAQWMRKAVLFSLRIMDIFHQKNMHLTVKFLHICFDLMLSVSLKSFYK